MALSFFFDIAKTHIRQALWFDSFFRTQMLGKIRKISQWVFALFFLAFLLTFLVEGAVSTDTSQLLLGISFLIFSYIATIIIIENFSTYLQNQKLSLANNNLAEFLSLQVAHATLGASRHARRKHLAHVDSTLLLYFLLQESPRLQAIFQRMLLDAQELQELLGDKVKTAPVQSTKQPPVFSFDFQETIVMALDFAQQQGRITAQEEDVFAALAVHNTFLKQFLIERNYFPEKDVLPVAQWHVQLRMRREEQKKFWLKKNLRRYGSLGKEWAAGYAITLEDFGFNISTFVEGARFPKAIGHKEEKKAIERVLSRQQINNVLLVGNPGSGRRRLIEDFASKSVLGENQSSLLNYQQVVELDLAQLLASLESMEDAEAVLQQAFREVLHAGNVILVIDEFHNFVGEGMTAAPGRVNIASVLISYLRRPDFPFIAMTTFGGLHRYIEQNPSLLSFFEKVEVSELSQLESLQVLQEIVPSYENLYKRFISYPALKAIIQYADKYIQSVPFPKKAVDLLDEAMGYLAQTEDKVLLPEHVAAVVTERTQIPVGDLETTERETLLDMETLIHKRIINQEEAVKEIASAMRRARAEVATRPGPMGSFLFLGPTGVGKTETAKALAAIYFGSERRMVRLDMSEFQHIDDIARLLGTATQDGLLTTSIRQNPFSLLLLDELEKAHPNVLNLFLQVLDEGHLTDGVGRKTDFRHTIVIATSNAGYQLILKALREQRDFTTLKQEMLDYVFEQGLYRPEFINRFDGVILFTPLSEQHLIQIAELMLKKLQYNMQEKGIDFVITEPLKAKIAKLGYNPTFGARNMRRVLQDKVENALAVALLADKVKRGQRITVDPATFEVKRV